MLQRREKRVLNEVFRVLSMPEQAHGKRHGPRQVTLDDLPERFTFSVPDARKELAVQVGVVVRAEHECYAPILLRRRRVRIPHLS
jgi:hypothetical protein